MRTVRLSWKKIVICCALFIVTYLIVRKYVIKKSESVKLKPVQSSLKEERDVPTESHAVFRTDGKLGNYEIEEPERFGPGEGGKAHHVKPDQKNEEDRLKSVYGFNQLVSDEISLDRSVPDMREPECKNWDYPDVLPTASVVFIFHNEGWSTLLRSVHSVINRSPAHLLHEVVLVDDKSELQHLHEQLEEEIKKPYYHGKVKLVRNAEREGLIRSRNNGAVAATGDVVVFLDAHCEVGPNWLPPLLSPIHDNPKTLSVPVIDGIEWSDFSIRPVYAQGQHSRGIFEWGMLYKEGPLPKKEANKRKYHSEPYNSPTHAGGLFAIKRSWFKQLGWYDPGLQIWGGENYELSYKLWQCGGRSVWVPCSRIGHVYRGHGCSSCHSGGVARKWGGVPLALRNYKRLIETWWDDKYKKFFYTREPLAEYIDMGDISKQIAIKENLQCKSFTWFMTEVAYDVLYKYPELSPNAYWGELKNTATHRCVDTHNVQPPQKIGTSGCYGYGGSQLMRLNTAGQFASGEWCIELQQGGQDVKMAWCPDGDDSGKWIYDEQSELMKYNSLCLTISLQNYDLILKTCDANSRYQKWTFRKIRPGWVDHQYKGD